MVGNIVLIGLMGSGKTSVGKFLADKTDKSFVDTDELIEQESDKTITEIFAEEGETRFRQIESNIINKVSKKNNLVISTGGGAVETPVNIENLKSSGTIFYLKATPETLYERVKNETHRPLLKNTNPLETLKILLNKREKFYNTADFIIDTENKTLEEISDEIILLESSCQ